MSRASRQRDSVRTRALRDAALDAMFARMPSPSEAEFESFMQELEDARAEASRLCGVASVDGSVPEVRAPQERGVDARRPRRPTSGAS
jgi:hypothetical protein